MRADRRLHRLVLLGCLVMAGVGGARDAGAQPAEPTAPTPTAGSAEPTSPAASEAPTAPAPGADGTPKDAPAGPSASTGTAPEGPAAAGEAPAGEAPATAEPTAPSRASAVLFRERAAVSDNRLAESALGGDAQRHQGVAVRVTTALGFGSASRERSRGDLKVSGFDAGIGLDVGGTPIDNLVVYGRAVGFAFDHASSDDSPNAGSAFFGLIGAGVRYHFMPIDLYAGGTLGLAAASVTNDRGTAQNTNPGYGLELEAGKSWWAGGYRDSWTLSLGLRFAYARTGAVSSGNGRNDEPWVGTAFSLVFATAYN